MYLVPGFLPVLQVQFDAAGAVNGLSFANTYWSQMPDCCVFVVTALVTVH